MKKEDFDLRLPDLDIEFSALQYMPKRDIKEFYARFYPNLSEQDFRRILYSLKNTGLISSTGSGIYYYKGYRNPSKKRYVPNLSAYVEAIDHTVREAFPYLSYLIWETSILNEFMLHQPGQSQVILEVEKGTEESVFNQLSDKYPGIVFLDPDRLTMERYVMQKPGSIIISKFISQTPRGRKIDKVPYAKIEKILVDLLVDDEKYFVYQGRELVSIFENVFDRYMIDVRSLFRYAGRRKADQKLRNFILEKTRVELITIQGDTT